MLKNLLVPVFVSLLFLGVIARNFPARADGLDDALPIPRALSAPLPPIVEDPSPLLPPEPEEALAEAPAPVKNLWPLISQGMILEKPGADGKIMASVDQKQMLAQGDIVYLSSSEKGFVKGQQWVVFKTTKDVRHPGSGAYLGVLVQVLGMAEVMEVNDDVATAQLTRSKEPITIGDKIGLPEHFMPEINEGNTPPEELSAGVIVEVRDNRIHVAQDDIIYIDYGSDEGVVRGDRFLVVHGGERSVFGSSFINRALPDRNIGSAIVLATQEHTSTAKIIQSIEPIAKGDTILYRSAE